MPKHALQRTRRERVMRHAHEDTQCLLEMF